MEMISLPGSVNPENIERIKENISKCLKNSSDEVTLFICSPGGVLSCAIHFYEWVRTEKIPLTTIAAGEVASAALIVLLAGRKRKATSHSWFCIHKGGGLKWDYGSKLLRILAPTRYKERVEWIKIMEQKAEEIILTETKISPEKLHHALRTYYIFDAYEAEKLGFIEEVITPA